jgi:pimeloyl-ACP methyl ester carboxylesterase
VERQDVWFGSGDARCAAWLYLPERSGPGPVVVMGHGLGATRVMRLPAYAERFVAAGYACLVFDYRHFGDSEGEPRQLLDIGRQRQDWRAAIAYARSLPQVDPERVVLWGTSFGGGHVLAVGADDSRVAAVVAQCPFTDGPASAAAMGPVGLARLSALALADVAGSLLGRAPVQVTTAGAPGSVALMNAPDVVPGYLALVPDGAEVVNHVAARVALTVPFERPGRALARLRCPVLLCVCDHDSVAPAGATLRHAARCPQAEVQRYPIGHFDVYVGADFERAVADQLEFLARHVPVG